MDFLLLGKVNKWFNISIRLLLAGGSFVLNSNLIRGKKLRDMRARLRSKVEDNRCLIKLEFIFHFLDFNFVLRRFYLILKLVHFNLVKVFKESSL